MTYAQAEKVRVWLREISLEAEFSVTDTYGEDRTKKREQLGLVIDKIENLTKAIRKEIK